MILDLFFSLAIPMIIIGLVVGFVIKTVMERRGIYQDDEGKAKRDEINRTHRTNLSSLIIFIIFLMIYAMIFSSLIDEWGHTFNTYLVGVIISLPMLVLAAVVIAVYNLIVHAKANRKN